MESFNFFAKVGVWLRLYKQCPMHMMTDVKIGKTNNYDGDIEHHLM